MREGAREESHRPRYVLPVAPEILLKSLPLARVTEIVIGWQDAVCCDEDLEPESSRSVTIPPPRLAGMHVKGAVAA